MYSVEQGGLNEALISGTEAVGGWGEGRGGEGREGLSGPVSERP